MGPWCPFDSSVFVSDGYGQLDDLECLGSDDEKYGEDTVV